MIRPLAQMTRFALSGWRVLFGRTSSEASPQTVEQSFRIALIRNLNRAGLEWMPNKGIFPKGSLRDGMTWMLVKNLFHLSEFRDMKVPRTIMDYEENIPAVLCGCTLPVLVVTG